jgi:hypothetical protein
VHTIASIVNFQCEERTALMLQNYQQDHPSVHEPADLQAAVNKYVGDYGVWSRISTVSSDSLYRTGLLHIMKLLLMRQDMIQHLTTPLAIVQGMYPGDGIKYLEKIKSCALHLTLWPRESKSRKAPRDVMGVEKGGRGPPQTPKGDKLCMNKREGRPCKLGLKCPFNHDGMSGRICTDTEYLNTGICS